MTTIHPRLAQTVLDCPDPRRLAEFYRELMGYRYRQGDEQPPAGEPDPRGKDWLVLVDPEGGRQLAFQADAQQVTPTWPRPEVGQQLHLDMTVDDLPALYLVHARVLELGGSELLARTDDPDEPLFVFADPAGHPFCVFVG